MKMPTDLIDERIETLKLETIYLADLIALKPMHLFQSYGFVFRCSSGPFHIEEYMIEDFSAGGSAQIISRRDTALILDTPMVWFPTPEIAAEVVKGLAFDFPHPLIHVFLRTPFAEIQTRYLERKRQISTLQQIIDPDRK